MFLNYQNFSFYECLSEGNTKKYIEEIINKSKKVQKTHKDAFHKYVQK